MPRVEELELEPRNVPLRPLKREGVQGKTRAPASDGSWALYVCFQESRREAVFHPCQSNPPFQSTLATSIPPHPLLPRHFGSDQPWVARLPRSSSLPAFCLTFFVLWVLWFMEGHRKKCVCVIAWLRSRVRRGASITHPGAVTKISINFFPSWTLCCVRHSLNGSPKLIWGRVIQKQKSNIGKARRCVCLFKPSEDVSCVKAVFNCVFAPPLLSLQSLLCFLAASCHSIPSPGVDSCHGQPDHFLVTCSMGLHWSPLTTLKGWLQRWTGAPVVVTINLSVHPPACSPVSTSHLETTPTGSDNYLTSTRLVVAALTPLPAT